MPRLLITIILIFGTAVVGLFYLMPEWQDFGDIRKDAEDLAGINEEFDVLIQNRDGLIDLINSVSKDDLKRIDRALPQGLQAAEFLVTLERLSAKHGLALKRVDLASSAAQIQPRGGQPRPGGAPAILPKGGALNEFPVGITISGAYESFKGFLSDLEKNLRVVDVQNITFTSPEKSSAFEIVIKAKTYYQ